MVRGRAQASAAVGMLCLVALTACASGAPPILSEAQRVGIRAQLEGQAASRYGAATGDDQTPGYDFGATVADHDWPQAIEACMLDRGFSVSVEGGYVLLVSVVDGGNRDVETVAFASAEYRCALLHPRVSSVAVYLDDAQRAALYDYYTRFVVPCLSIAGATSTAPPPRQEFVSDFFSFPWHPYDAVWSTDPGESRAGRLEALCPPVPRWLDLGR